MIKIVKKPQKSRLLGSSKNPANKDYERRGVITKGSVLETELGSARVVSRPGQDGIVNAVINKTMIIEFFHLFRKNRNLLNIIPIFLLVKIGITVFPGSNCDRDVL